MTIGIRAARIDAGFTQQEVADHVGKSKNTIASYEAYTTKPDIETAQAMAAMFGRSVDDIDWARG